jgi:hypothetical protein
LPETEAREDGELLFNGYGVPGWELKHFPEMDGGDGCTTMSVHLISLN